MYCKVSVFFAYISLIYIIASSIYMIITRLFVGTPLRNEIEKNEKLLKIRNESKNLRGKIFAISMVLAIMIAFIYQPFSSEPDNNNVISSKLKNIRVY